MKEFLNILVEIISVDIFVGYGLYTLLFIAISLFNREFELLKRLDVSANRFIIFSGIIYFLGVLILTVLSINEIDEGSSYMEYSWVPWTQPFLWIFITQLLWIKKIRKRLLLRFLISVLLIISFEKYVIIVTSFHRDYSPGVLNLFSELSATEILFGLTIKIAMFCLLAIVYAFVVDRLKKFVT